MSVLLVAPPTDLGASVVERLVAQGDDVRVAGDRVEADEWRKLGAHVAPGSPDLDLIERAGQGSRTMVIFREPSVDEIEAARLARIERIVVATNLMSREARERLEQSGLSYVILYIGRRRRWKRVIEPTDIAIAVDAADDLAGDVKLELDLAEPSAWEALRVERSP